MSFFKKFGKGNKGESNTEVLLNPFAKPGDNGNSGKGDDKTVVAPTQMTSEEQDAAVRGFMKKEGLYEGIDANAMMAAAASGDGEVFGQHLARAMENAVRVSTIAAERLTKAQVATASAAAVNEAQQGTRNEMARTQLNKDLPFTQEPELAPIADTVLNGFLAQGQSVPEAIASTGAYFEATAKTAGQHFGMQVEPTQNQRPGQQSFRQSNDNPNDNYSGPGQNNQGDDWVAHLTSGNESFESINNVADPGGQSAGEGTQSPTGE